VQQPSQAPSGKLEGLGEVATPLLGMEAERRVGEGVFLLGVSAGPSWSLFPCGEDGSGLEALIPPVLPLPAQPGMLPLQPSVGRLENSLGCC